jgi:hypothetical protein
MELLVRLCHRRGKTHRSDTAVLLEIGFDLSRSSN